MGLLGEKWEVPWGVQNFLFNYDEKIRGYSIEELLEITTFRRNTWFWRSGMTPHRDNVILSDEVTDSDDKMFIAVVIAHELVHVAQQEDWGHVLFMLKYGLQAIPCFFRYECMKGKSIEREAFDYEDRFGIDIGFYKPKIYAMGDRNRIRVAKVVDLQLKNKYVKSGDSKPTVVS